MLFAGRRGGRLWAAIVMLMFAQEASAAGARPPWPARKRRVESGLLRPGVHELKNLERWPAEPASPTPIDAKRFQAAFSGLCEGMTTARMLRRIADEILETAGEAGIDPFLLAAYVYRESRCVPTLVTGFGTGLLQIQAGMIQGNLRGGSLRYQVLENGAWKERVRPVPRGALLRLQNSRINLQLGAAMSVIDLNHHTRHQ